MLDELKKRPEIRIRASILEAAVGGRGLAHAGVLGQIKGLKILSQVH